MADHVSVGVIEDYKVVALAADCLAQAVCNLDCAHLGTQVVSRDLGRIDEDTVFTLERGFTAAVEEEGHVGVLLSFCYAELLEAGAGDGFSQSISHFLLGEEDMESLERCVIGGKGAVVQRNGVHAVLWHVVLGEDCGEFAGAVVTEVVEYDGISRFNFGEGLATCCDDDGLDEFVCHPFVIRGLDALERMLVLDALALDKHVIRLFDAFPALVAVHSVEAAADGCNLAGGLSHLLFQLLHEAVAAAGVSVAAVHKAVYIHFFYALVLCLRKELVQMLKGGMHAAVRAETKEMELAPSGLDIVVRCAYLFVLQ